MADGGALLTRNYPGRGLHPALDRLLDRWDALEARLVAEGSALCARLTPRDVRQLHRARALFHACSIIPCALYYLGTSERPTKFPATISFTIRKGLPRWAHHVLWAAGWACMGEVICNAGSRWVQRFTASMVATGVWTVVVFRLGHGPLSDLAHFLGAGVYMLDHEMLCSVFRVDTRYRTAFRASFLLMLGALVRGHALERVAGIGGESRVSPAVRARQIAAAPFGVRRKLWRADLAIMLFENLLFASFVHGVTSGAPALGGAALGGTAGSGVEPIGGSVSKNRARDALAPPTSPSPTRPAQKGYGEGSGDPPLPPHSA